MLVSLLIWAAALTISVKRSGTQNSPHHSNVFILRVWYLKKYFYSCLTLVIDCCTESMSFVYSCRSFVNLKFKTKMKQTPLPFRLVNMVQRGKYLVTHDAGWRMLCLPGLCVSWAVLNCFGSSMASELWFICFSLLLSSGSKCSS